MIKWTKIRFITFNLLTSICLFSPTDAPMNDWRQSSNYLQQPIPSAPAFVLRRDPQFGEDRNGWPPQQVPPPPPIGAQQVYYVQQPMASDVEMMGGNMGGGIPGMAPTAANIQVEDIKPSLNDMNAKISLQGINKK